MKDYENPEYIEIVLYLFGSKISHGCVSDMVGLQAEL